jgi:hypothetical protein
MQLNTKLQAASHKMYGSIGVKELNLLMTNIGYGFLLPAINFRLFITSYLTASNPGTEFLFVKI